MVRDVVAHGNQVVLIESLLQLHIDCMTSPLCPPTASLSVIAGGWLVGCWVAYVGV